MSFLITNGNSTLRDADATFISAAAVSVPQSHACARTNAKPSRISRSAERVCRRSSGRGESMSAATVDTAKVPASASSAVPAPEVAITTPPIAGPTRPASGRMNHSSAFACGSSSVGTSSGMIEPKAGANNASPKPVRATSSPNSQSRRLPVTDSAPAAPRAPIRTRSPAIIIFRRSNRSVSTPPRRREPTSGAV